MLNRIFHSACLLLFSLLLSAQPEMTQLQPGQTPDGVVYYLPKTALHIHLLIEKQTYTPGQFARYAERYLHQKGVVQQEQISQRIVSCEVSSFGVRDTSKCYSVRLKGKAETAEVRLSEQGTLLAVNDEPLAYSIPTLSTFNSHLSTVNCPRNATLSKRELLTLKSCHQKSTWPIFNTKTAFCRPKTRIIWKYRKNVVPSQCQSKADALGPREARARSSKATNSEQTTGEPPTRQQASDKKEKTKILCLTKKQVKKLWQ